MEKSTFFSPFRSDLFAGRRALIVGVANERSLAWFIAEQLAACGAELAFTFQGETLERRVRPLAERVGAKLVIPCDVAQDADLDRLFEALSDSWQDGFDILIHSVAFAQREDLEGRFVDTSREGFRVAMDISAYSLVALAKRAEPLMEARGGGSILTLTYYGAEKVVPNYNVMGVAKAALEASVRYLANDLGPKKIRVNAISAGPVKTLAAAGIRDFRTILAKAEERTPLRENIHGSDVGSLATFLCSPSGAHITGSNHYLDSGAHILGM